MASASRLEAFDAECSAFVDVLGSLGPDDLDRPTNCPPWTLHELVVHVAFSITMPERPKRSRGPPEATAADYYRRPERDTDAYRAGNVERTRSIASSVDRAELASSFVGTWERARATFAAHDVDELIEAGGLALSVDSYLLTRLMSVAAHGVDVAITLDRRAWTTPTALSELCPVLVDLLGAEPPERWSDQDLLEYGTGRRPLREPDREALGPLAARFPLLS